MRLTIAPLLLAVASSACDSTRSEASPPAPFGIDAYEVVDVTVLQPERIYTHYNLEPVSWNSDSIRFRYARQAERATQRTEFFILPISQIHAVRAPRLDTAGAAMVPTPMELWQAEQDAKAKLPADD